ncbi:MAG: GTPase HflX [Oscillospiraceae bacterium]|nr:GTPase HflX [Oscillospiraceae bacterium]
MNQAEKEKAILVGLCADSMEPKERSSDDSMDELEELLETAGGECCAKVLQNRHEPEPRTFIGDGKVQEVKALAEANDCVLAVFDNELSPSQMRALSDDLGIRVIDRSSLILDIFASRARTSEGRLQVELAQYKYLLPRLTGMWTHLVRQSASASPIGTRGPGETQLETDRRHIRRKITRLEQELDEVRKVRGTQRRRREKNGMPVIALVGYTNAGKSTLLNCLTDAGIPAKNRLFDTLDTTTRRFRVSDTLEVLVSDTVGFIRKLPHHLVEAFKATLEELTYADLIIHVIDASNPNWSDQVDVVDELILELGAENTPRIEAFNKFDKVPDEAVLPKGDHIVRISAKTGAGIDTLVAKIGQLLDNGKCKAVLRIPYDKGAVVETLHKDASVVNTEYKDDFIQIEAVMTPETYGKVKPYVFISDVVDPNPEDYWGDDE